MKVSCINKNGYFTIIPLALLLCDEFIPLTQITLRPNKQLLSTVQHANRSFFLVTSWFYSVYNIVTHWVNFREKHLHEHDLQLSDYNMGKYCRQNVQIFGRKICFSDVCL